MLCMFILYMNGCEFFEVVYEQQMFWETFHGNYMSLSEILPEICGTEVAEGNILELNTVFWLEDTQEFHHYLWIFFLGLRIPSLIVNLWQRFMYWSNRGLLDEKPGFLSADLWQKLWVSDKIAMKSFSKICRSESTLNCRSRHLSIKLTYIT